MRYASIDIGTVTSRLLIADVGDTPEAGLIELERRMQITHLGRGLDHSKTITSEAIDRQVAACTSFLADIARFENQTGSAVDDVFAVATSAMRDAENRSDVLAALADIGLSVRVIEGGTEALLSFMGAVSGFSGGSLAGRAPNHSGQTDPQIKIQARNRQVSMDSPVLLIDVGGGSTELVLGTRGSGRSAPEIILSRSFDVGSSRITERFLKSDPPTHDELLRARDFIGGAFDSFLREVAVTPLVAVAVAGTATSVVSVRDALRVYDPARVHGRAVTAGELDDVLEKLSTLSLRQRRECVGLQPDRAPVILGGILILQSIVNSLPGREFIVSETDLLQGILLGRQHLT